MEIKVVFEAPVGVDGEAEAEIEVEADEEADWEADEEADAEAEAEVDTEADVVDEQTQPTSAMLVIGGALQVAWASHGATEVYGASPLTFSILTRTGMTAPVLKLNLRWPTTRRRLAISPEWLVILRKEFLSDEKMESRALLERSSCAEGVSAVVFVHSSSFSVKPASKGHPG